MLAYLATGYECDGCGACCKTFPIFVSAADAQREPRIRSEGQELPPWLATERWRFRLFPLPFHQTCCFLDGDNRCTVYVSRPETCRTFAAGGEQCQEARRLAGLPPLLANQEIAAQ